MVDLAMLSESTKDAPRIAQAKREQRLIVHGMLCCILLLPLKAFASLEAILYIVLLSLSMMLLLVTRVTRRKPIELKLIFLGVGTICYLVFCWLINGGQAFNRLIQYALMISVMLSMGEYRWDSSDVHRLNALFTFVMVISGLYWVACGMPINYFSSIYGHSNGFSNVIICAVALELLDILLVNKKQVRVRNVAYLVLCVALLMAANSRSAMLSLLVCMLAFLYIVRRGKRIGIKRQAATLFLLTVAAALVFSVLYPSLYGTELGVQLEMLSREYLNKNFFSGREVIWRMILSAIEGKALFGLGLSMEPSMIYDTGYSAHNFYLQTILQSGLIGLALVLGLLLFVVLKLSGGKSSVSCFGIAFVLGLLIHECFEVSLTQVNFAYGIAYWMIFGICISLAEESDKSELALRT